MKKIALISIFTLAACSQNTAMTPKEQVFGHTPLKTLNISQVKQQPDDALVTFVGKIIRKVDNDEYIVLDETGEIQVEIDDHIWNGLNVTPTETIQISGEVDKETFHTKVDAKSVQKVK